MTVSTVDARKQFSEIINRAAYGKERIVLTRRGKPLVAVVPVEDMELLELLEDRIDIAAARKALQEPGTIPWEKAKFRVGPVDVLQDQNQTLGVARWERSQ